MFDVEYDHDSVTERCLRLMVSMSEPFYNVIIYLYYLWFQCQNLFIISLYIYIIYIFASPQARQGRGTSSGPFPR